MAWTLRIDRIWTLLLLAALLVLAPRAAAAQAEDEAEAEGATMVGLKFDGAELSSSLQQKLRQGVIDTVGETPLKFVDFKAASAEMDPVTQDCFTADCLQKIGAQLEAPLGLRVEISGENEIYAWTFETWDLQAGRRIDSVRKTCELCGEPELVETFSTSLKEMLDSGPPAPEEAFELPPGHVLVQVNAVPEEAEILFDGEVVGQGFVVLAVAPGEHDLHIRMDGYRDIQEHILMNEDTKGPVLFRYHLSSSSAQVLEAPPTVGPIDRLGADTRLMLGLVGVGAGVVSLGTGIYLAAIDGDPACEAGVAVAACPDVYATAGGGIAMSALGAVLLTGGVTLLSWELLAGEPVEEQNLTPESPDSGAAAAGGASVSLGPSLSPDGGGFVLSGSF